MLRVTPRTVLVLANSSAGVWFGAQTLLQLLRSGPGGTAAHLPARIPSLTISDWPDSPDRANYIQPPGFVSRGR